MSDGSSVRDSSPPSEPPASSSPGLTVTREEVDEKLRKQPWELLHHQLVLLAMKILHGRTFSIEQEAKELAQEAILRARDPRYEPWNFKKQPSLWKFLVGIVNRLLSNKYSSYEYTHYGGSLDEPDAMGMPSPYKDPEQELLEHEEDRIKDEMLVRVRAHLEEKNDRLALSVMTLFEEEVTSVAEQETRTGATEDQVKGARQRLHEAGTAVLRARQKETR